LTKILSDLICGLISFY